MATKTASTFAFNGFEVARKANTLLITTNAESGAKYYYTDDMSIVKSIVAGINALAHNHFAETVDGSLYLHKTMDEILSMPVGYENAGYAYGHYLATLDEQGLLRRTMEVKPRALYRLDWDGFGFKTAEVTYKKYEEGEYEGVGGPKHNRNTLSMIEGIQRVKNAMKNGANVELGVLLMNQDYLGKILSGWTLICKGKVEEAHTKRNEAIASARVKGAVERIQKLAEVKPEVVEKMNASITSLKMNDGTDAPVEELMGVELEYYMKATKLSNAPMLVTRDTLASLERAQKAGVTFGVKAS